MIAYVRTSQTYFYNCTNPFRTAVFCVELHTKKVLFRVALSSAALWSCCYWCLNVAGNMHNEQLAVLATACSLVLARLMGQYCFAHWCLSLSVTLPAGGSGAWMVFRRRARGRSGSQRCTAGQYGYVPLGQHLV